jgi:hypothetical protein
VTRQPTMLVQPFADLAVKARRLGFKMEMSHDADERVVSVRCLPEAEWAMTRVREVGLADGEPDPIGIVASTHYGALDPLLDVIRLTAVTALERTQDVMAG